MGELGELSEDEWLESKEFVWKIPDVFSLPKKADYKVNSPIFSIAGATWCLEMYPYGQTERDSQSFIDFVIARLRSFAPEHEIFYEFSIQTSRGKEFKHVRGVEKLNVDIHEINLIKYLDRSQLITQKNAIAPNDILKVRCQIGYKKTIGVEASSQTQEVEKKLVRYGVDKTIHDFKQLLLNEEDSDVTIIVKGQEFRAHRAVIKARCSVFASMFKNEMKENATGVVDIEDCDPATFPDFLCFLYAGSVEKLSSENAFSLYTTADKYDVQELKSQCLCFIKHYISIDTFCDTIKLAVKYSETELIERSSDFFAEHLPRIIVTVKWQKFLTEYPIQANELLIKALVSGKDIKK